MKSAFVAFALMIGVVVVPPYGAVKGSDAAQSIVVAGLTRTFIIHEPARAGSGLRSLVIAFHGGGGQGQGMIRLTHFDKVADEHGFVVVFPDGEARQWNDGRAGVKRSNADDIAFVRALIARLIATDRIDPQRVYATGMSNGGFFSYRLGCELSNQIAAIAPVAATMPVPLDQSCRPARPVPVIAFNGTDD